MNLITNTHHDDVLAQRLRDLPTLSAPVETMSALEKIALPMTKRASWHWPAAMAASVLMCIAALVMYSPADREPVTLATAQQPDSVSSVDMQQLFTQSAYLDRVLAEMPTRGQVRRVGTASTITALEDRVATIDAQLGDALVSDSVDAAELLLRERVGLMTSLVELRFDNSMTAALWL